MVDPAEVLTMALHQNLGARATRHLDMVDPAEVPTMVLHLDLGARATRHLDMVDQAAIPTTVPVALRPDLLVQVTLIPVTIPVTILATILPPRMINLVLQPNLQ